MPRPRLSLLLALALVLAPCAYPALDASGMPATPGPRKPRNDTLAYLEGLPETNPYRATLLRLHALPAADLQALTQWADGSSDGNAPAPSLTPEQQTLAREFSAALVASSAQPPTHAEDWPVLRGPDNPDNPANIIIPDIGLARRLARLAVKTADSLSTTEAIAIYSAVAQFGRQQRAGATLIEQLTGMAIEGTAFNAAGRRLPEFSPTELQKLSADWAALYPRPDNAHAFAGERDLFFAPIINDILRPGLAALLAGNAETGGTPATQDRDPDTGFTRHLRLSGLVDLGDGERRISLENTSTGVTFTIAEGKRTDGIALVRLDFEKHEAVIRRGSREAVIHLESKRIVERRNGRDDIARLRKFFTASADMLGPNEDLLKGLVERARRHPGGAEGYVNDLINGYQRIIDAQLASADSPEASETPPVIPDSEDPFLKLTLSGLGRVGRSLNNSATSATALQAAIHHRLVQLGAAAPDAAPVDPWAADASPFAYEATPDGGFLLRSRYEVDPDQPLTYKFAAPDAGFVRTK